jgi:hypothetical protein
MQDFFGGYLVVRFGKQAVCAAEIGYSALGRNPRPAEKHGAAFF